MRALSPSTEPSGRSAPTITTSPAPALWWSADAMTFRKQASGGHGRLPAFLTRWTASKKTKTQWWLRFGRCWLQRFVLTVEIGSAFDPPVAVGLDARTTCASMRGL